MAAVVATAMAGIAACTQPIDPMPVEPGVDFEAHFEHRGLVVDRMGGDDPAVLEQQASFYSRGPDFLLVFNDQPVAALWLKEGSQFTVRQAADPNAPVIGRVDASWQQGAIRLAFNPADGPAYSTGRFHRVDEMVGRPALLGPEVSTNLDVRGVYRAEVRDAKGVPIGWLRVSIDTHPGATRVYDGVLPHEIDGPLAVAAVELVNTQVDNIEGHAVNLDQGD